MIDRSDKSKGPIWCPTMDSSLGEKIDQLVDRATGKLVAVLAWNPTFERIITSRSWDRPNPKVEFHPITTSVHYAENWFTFLGLRRTHLKGDGSI